MSKLPWSGVVTSVQPRIRLNRSFDERYHNYLGYCLFVDGQIDEERESFSIGIGKATQSTYRFRVGDRVSGESIPVPDPRMEPVEFYRTSKLQLNDRDPEPNHSPPPWHGVPPDLETYRSRGHRRLSSRTYESKCRSCIWGCRMPVEMLIDPWNPSYRYRYETFCYGPKSCPFYRAGATRLVPGRKGMRYVEEDWVDDEETSHRSMDE